ncbi:MAG: histidinol-phosphatase [Erysipelotrichaceae bacterium]
MIKQLFNFHTHTYRCQHGVGTEEEYVVAAIKAGYKQLGFSDHMPCKGIIDPGERMSFDEVEDYINTINALKIKYRDKIQIFSGFETDYWVDRLDEILYLKDKVDYLILGNHQRALHVNDYFVKVSDDDLVEWVKRIEIAMKTNLVKIIAHPDLFMLVRDEFGELEGKAADAICRLSKQYNVPLEINLRGVNFGKLNYGGDLRYPYPFRDFWVYAQKHQCPVIFGLDAHSPNNFTEMYRFNEIEEIIKGLNLNILSEYKIK